MRREIKFRAWDTRQFYEDAPIMREMDYLYSYFEQGGTFDEEHRTGELAFMQFTGVYDSDGVPIYEGDILSESIYDVPGAFCGEAVSVVESRYCAFRKVDVERYATRDDKGEYGQVYQGDILDAYWNPTRRINNTIVIGNIYENPELLK